MFGFNTLYRKASLLGKMRTLKQNITFFPKKEILGT